MILETTSKFGTNRQRNETYAEFTNEAAYSYAMMYLPVWLITTFLLCGILFILNQSGYVLRQSGLYLSEIDMLMFMSVWSMSTSWIFYKTLFHSEKYRLREDWLDYLNRPTEITERQVQEETSVMNYQDMIPTAVLNNGESLIDKIEQEENVGNMIFTSDMMAIIRRLAIESNRMSRDHVWQPMKDEGLFSETVVKHYQQSRKLFEHREWVIGRKWTPKAYREFLKVTPPTENE